MGRKSVRIHKIKDGQESVLAEGSHQYPLGSPLRIETSGGKLSVYINTELVLFTVDNEFTQGYLGIGAAQSEYGYYGSEWLDEFKASSGDEKEAIAVWRMYS